MTEDEYRVSQLRTYVGCMNIFMALINIGTIMGCVLLLGVEMLLWTLVTTDRCSPIQALLLLPLLSTLMLSATRWYWIWNFKDQNRRCKHITQRILERIALLTVVPNRALANLIDSFRILRATHEQPHLYLRRRERVHIGFVLLLGTATPFVFAFLLASNRAASMEAQLLSCIAGIIMNLVCTTRCAWVSMVVAARRARDAWSMDADGSFRFEVPYFEVSDLSHPLRSIRDLTIIVSPDGEVNLNECNSQPPRTKNPGKKRPRLYVVT